MLEVNSGDKIQFDVYYIKERKEQEVIKPDGSKGIIHSVDAKIVVNPTETELSKPNIEVVSKKTIYLEIMEVNKIGKELPLKSYLLGCRIVEGDYISPTFHIRVKDPQELKNKVISAFNPILV